MKKLVPIVIAAKVLVAATVACFVAFPQRPLNTVLAGEKRPVTAASDTQAEDIPRMPAAEAAERMHVPEGFHVEVFAAEPDVRQPIAMTTDGRGRLWVAENYTYAERAKNFDLAYNDRIVILEDTDQDGRADRRTVFWDGAQRLTSVEVGFGGVWALCPPHLLFLPDADGDDVPDGEPIVMLDGWDDSEARHNFVNGLRWGPDGWLYGRNGILATCNVGPPGCADSERQAINCGIWRYHPLEKRFEVVCHGTTNPWGSDWDEHGQMFFINTVIGHLWHVVPGAHYERMYGADLNPYVYELIPQTADHFHWDAEREKWSDVRNAGVTETSDRLGGGHAHSGLMIYQGDNWPPEYRGELFTVNLHGRRVNRDSLERHGATYVGRHRPDFLRAEDPWFRGLELHCGPDGSVYLMDWSDIGECHENDGVHRTSGRIYRIRHGEKATPPKVDIARASGPELVEMQRHANAWFARQARRELQQRAARGEKLDGEAESLRRLFDTAGEVPHKLRALWCLHALGRADAHWLARVLQHPDEHVRVWAIRLLVDSAEPPRELATQLAQRAGDESSGLVLTYLASSLQRLPHADRWALAEALGSKSPFAEDPVYPRMLWYGLEPVVAGSPERAAEFASHCRIPLVTRLVARRLASAVDERPEALAPLVRLAATPLPAARRSALIQGMADGLRGWLRAPRPVGWTRLEAVVVRDGSAADRDLVRELSVVFGDGRALRELTGLATDGAQPLETRRSAIRALGSAQPADLPALLDGLLTDRELGETAVRALRGVARPETWNRLLQKYPTMRRGARQAVVQVLASRPASAAMLLDAVAADAVDREDVGAFELRQMQLLGDKPVADRVAELWPELQRIDDAARARLAEYRGRLSPEALGSADASAGRKVFASSCGKCHKLFGEGGSVGPDLTGAQRSNLNYWLDNVLTPSAQVAANYRMSIVILEDGRVLNGVLGNETGRTVTLQTPEEKLTLDRQTIEATRPSALSLMPDGLLEKLSDQELEQLFAYLMAPGPPR